MAKKINDDLLKEIRTRFEQLNTNEASDRKLFLEDLCFTYNIGDGQWPEEIRRKRKNKPCLTSPKLRKFVAQVANRERDMRMAMKVRPVDDYGDPKTADIYDGILRHIEYQSTADEVYSHGGMYALAGGWGYWRVRSDFVPDDVVQEILIEKIDNPLSVWLDPRGNYCFIREGLTKDEFKAQYPDAEYVDTDSSSYGDAYALWYEKDKIFVSEYYKRELYDKTIAKVLFPDNSTKIIELTKERTAESLTAAGLKIITTRTFKSYRIKWYKVTGNEVLEEITLPGTVIPVVQVEGDFVNIDGKIHRRSFIRDGKDSQRLYNYSLSTFAETVALQPKAPYLVFADEIEGYTDIWDNGEAGDRFYLPVNRTAGNTRPRREQPPQVAPGVLAMLNIADKDIPDTIGLYEASFGQVSNERTGVAIRNRAQRSDLTTYHFPDNLRRAILKTVRICIEWIPSIYDTERVVRMRGEDGKNTLAEINKTVLLNGKPVILNDLSVGRYDVEGDIKNYSNRRQEAVEQMTYVMQTAPQASPFLLPIIAEANDFPFADKVKAAMEEFKATVLQPKTPPPQEQIPPEGIINQPVTGAEGEQT